MPIIRAQVVLPHVSGVPKDNVVNTFHFSGDMAGEVDHQLVHARIVGFYNTLQSPGFSVASLLSRAIDRTLNKAKIKTYTLGPGPEGAPDLITSWTPAAPYSQSLLPAEVALCLSYFAGENSVRRRGRIYLGPLIGDVVDVDATTGRAFVGEPMRRTIARSAQGLINAPGNPSWAVYSRVDNVARLVTGGWVDDAFDTQRRRGERPVVRTALSATA